MSTNLEGQVSAQIDTKQPLGCFSIGSTIRYNPTGEIGTVWNIIDDKFIQVDFGKGKFTNGRTLTSNCTASIKK